MIQGELVKKRVVGKEKEIVRGTENQKVVSHSFLHERYSDHTELFPDD